jgi:hypothetical protein
MYSARCSGASALNTGRVSSPGFIAVKTAIQACCGSAAGIPAAAFITRRSGVCRRRPRRWSRPYQSIWPVPRGSFYEPAAVHNGREDQRSFDTGLAYAVSRRFGRGVGAWDPA